MVPLSSQNLAENPGSSVDNPDYEGRETRTLYALNTKTNKQYAVSAVHLAENEYCVVYGENSAGISLKAAENIASRFKDSVFPVITGVFGDFRENLGDRGFGRYDKLTLFLLDIKDSYNSVTAPSYIAGYFSPKDILYSRTSLSYSNEGALLYLDVNPGNPNDDGFFSTIAHEFQHLINFSLRIAQQGGGTNVKPQNTWIDEGLASAAEYLYSGKHSEQKIAYFNSDTRNSFSRGDTFFTWDSEYEDYCTIYLFFQWLRIQAKGNPEIYTDIINSSHLDYRAVTDAAAKHLGESFDDWETLLSDWLLANHVNASTGVLGYNGEITTRIRAITGTGVSLAPGAGVFSYLDGTGFSLPSNAQSGSHIRYIGVTEAGQLILWEGLSSSGTKGRLLTFNANTVSKARGTQTDSQWDQEIAGVSEYGYLTGKVASQPRAVDGAARDAVLSAGPYPVDIPPVFFLE
jgi:hypothetical protein